ncbi:UNVERIFIED_ORG: hypothetical protein E4P37_00005, partial [Bacillus sp. AZ43]
MGRHTAAGPAPGIMSPPWFVCLGLDRPHRAAPGAVRLGERFLAPGEALLDRAQRRGLGTVVLSRDPADDGDGAEWLVDRWVACDTHDPRAVLAALRALGGPVAAVVGGGAATAVPAASVARVLGLRGPSPEALALALGPSAAPAAGRDGD